MIKERQITNIDFGQVDYNPAIIDYDFVNNRPRGGSCRIDFFSHGMLSSALEGITGETKVFLKKDNVFFDYGMFLLDFEAISKEPAILENMVKDMKYKRIYLEKSDKYQIENLINGLSDIEIILMRFECLI